MRKLIIQIPCYNEAESLPVTLSHLPREVAGFDVVEWLVIDDGSSDDTHRIAAEHGVDHVVRHVTNMGLATAFMTGLHAGLEQGADVIVNTDADNQYDARDIPTLTAPIVSGDALMVIGARPINDIAEFSATKRALQKLGSWTVRMVSNTDIEDAPSGMRAIHREAAVRLFVFNNYTYTLETIIQGGRSNIPVLSVPIRTNRVDGRRFRSHSVGDFDGGVARWLWACSAWGLYGRPYCGQPQTAARHASAAATGLAETQEPLSAYSQ